MMLGGLYQVLDNLSVLVWC